MIYESWDEVIDNCVTRATHKAQRMRRIIQLRFGLGGGEPQTTKQIADAVGSTAANVSTKIWHFRRLVWKFSKNVQPKNIEELCETAVLRDFLMGRRSAVACRADGRRREWREYHREYDGSGDYTLVRNVPPKGAK
jgi:hypothetical protein